MGLLEIILIAIGLSMDTFAVSITLGLSAKKPGVFKYFIPGIYFGLFQAIMPLIGFFAGTLFAAKIMAFDHWIAFALLGFIGGKMIIDSFSKKEIENNETSFRFIKMLLLAVATSIDALTVGITFAFFQINLLAAVLIIGFTTFIVSTGGMIVGNRFGIMFKSKAEFLGGAVLVLIGLKILIEHLFFT
ncbi:MAG: manganese efflux pump MntP family protein [Treponema sp.]|nr:manganese efflux pump MntP family protein [Treponema sp.]